MIVVDTETERFSPGNMAPRPVLYQIGGVQPPGAPGTYAHNDAVLTKTQSPFLAGCLAGAAPLCVMNGAYDFRVLAEHDPHVSIEQVFGWYDAGRVHDVQVRQKLLDIARACYYQDGEKYNLGTIAARHGQHVDKNEAWRLRYAELEHVPFSAWPKPALDYAAADVTVPPLIWAAQEESRYITLESGRADIFADQARASRALWALGLVSCQGVRIDKEALEYYEWWVQDRISRTQSILLDHGLLRFVRGKGYSKKAKVLDDRVRAAWTKRVRYDSLGAWLRANEESVTAFRARSGLEKHTIESLLDGTPIEGISADRAKIVADCTDWQFAPYPRSAKAQAPKKDEHVARALDMPELNAWVEYSSATAAQSRYSELVKGITAPIHTRFDIRVTGRSGSSAPNLQNRPKKGPDRSCFRPANGEVYLDTDHAGLELVCFAQVLLHLGCGGALANALNRGDDGHLILAGEILGVDWRTLERGNKRVDDARQMAKAGNFGLSGGMGLTRFIATAFDDYGLVLTMGEAKTIKAAWMRAWPEVREYFKIKGRETRSGSAVLRQLYSGRVRGGCGFTDACNTTFQGLGADLTTDILYELQRATRATPRDPKPIIARGLELGASVDVPALAVELGRSLPEVCNAILHGARVENYVHDQYLLAVRYSPEWCDGVLVDKGLTLRARAKEALIAAVAKRWLPDMIPRADAMACVRWSKDAAEVHDENGYLIVWEDSPDARAVMKAIKGDGAATELVQGGRDWLAMREAQGGFDRAYALRELESRVYSHVGGYRGPVDTKGVLRALDCAVPF